MGKVKSQLNFEYLDSISLPTSFFVVDNLMQIACNVLSSIRWYFGKIKRLEAEKKLLLGQNEHGAFLIRDSESRRNDFSLSVRDGDTVKHYRIRQLDEGGFFIARRTSFRTLQELVEHYSRDADGLCVNLRSPCAKVRSSLSPTIRKC